MTGTEASAPGKLMLIGEYAVLEGAQALVMAVNRRVRVKIEEASGCRGRLNAPQLGIREAPMRLQTGRLQCDGVQPDALGLTGRLIPGILRALGRAPEDVANIDIGIDSGALFESYAGRTVKLGLGSSAAVCAALAVALTDWFEGSPASSPAAARLDRWLPVYREALGARASGADLAAALFGGFCRFQSNDDAADCRPAAWPRGLFWRAVWTRQAAQTTDFVDRFEAWKRSDRAGSAEILARLAAIARTASANAADDAGLFSACRAYGDEMVGLAQAMDAEIITPLHRRLAEFGRKFGVVYKTCGAGGGDLGIALSLDPDRLSAFETGVSDCGGVPLNLAISESGAGLASRRLPEAGEENQ